MEQDILRKLQLTQLEILKEIDRVCRLNHISYFVDSGTLLGAVRHQGFIPWDDDLDIGMLREDYKRFQEIAPRDLGGQYVFVTCHTEPDYPFMFGKVMKKGTVYQEEKSKKVGFVQGIYVDVFPFDHFPAEEKQQKKQGKQLTALRAMIRNKAGYATWVKDGKTDYVKLAKNIPFKLASIFFSRPYLIKKYESVAERYNSEDTEVYYTFGISRYGKWRLPVEAIRKTVLLPFEDALVPCPEGYDQYLRLLYGDYLELPPEEERENRHLVEELKF